MVVFDESRFNSVSLDVSLSVVWSAGGLTGALSRCSLSAESFAGVTMLSLSSSEDLDLGFSTSSMMVAG